MSTAVDHQPLLLRKPEAARLLAMSVSTLEKLTCRRQIPHLKLGRAVYYDVADLRAWIDARKIPIPPSVEILAV